MLLCMFVIVENLWFIVIFAFVYTFLSIYINKNVISLALLQLSIVLCLNLSCLFVNEIQNGEMDILQLLYIYIYMYNEDMIDLLPPVKTYFTSRPSLAICIRKVRVASTSSAWWDSCNQSMATQITLFQPPPLLLIVVSVVVTATASILSASVGPAKVWKRWLIHGGHHTENMANTLWIRWHIVSKQIYCAQQFWSIVKSII